jgi:hypothetical protein
MSIAIHHALRGGGRVMLRAWVPALLLVACAPQAAPQTAAPAHTAPSLDAAQASVGRIELCKTTEADLRASFGPSMRDGRLGRYRVQSWVIGRDPERILAVVLDVRAVVVDLSWDTPGVLDWIPRDQCTPGS